MSVGTLNLSSLSYILGLTWIIENHHHHHHQVNDGNYQMWQHKERLEAGQTDYWSLINCLIVVVMDRHYLEEDRGLIFSDYQHIGSNYVSLSFPTETVRISSITTDPQFFLDRLSRFAQIDRQVRSRGRDRDIRDSQILKTISSFVNNKRSLIEIPLKYKHMC